MFRGSNPSSGYFSLNAIVEESMFCISGVQQPNVQKTPSGEFASQGRLVIRVHLPIKCSRFNHYAPEIFCLLWA
jgi:hypothetical protein